MDSRTDMRKLISICEGIHTQGPDQRAPDTFPVSGEFARDKRTDYPRYGSPETNQKKHQIATELAAAWAQIEDQIRGTSSHEQITKLEKQKAELSNIARKHEIGNILTYIISARAARLQRRDKTESIDPIYEGWDDDDEYEKEPMLKLDLKNIPINLGLYGPKKAQKIVYKGVRGLIDGTIDEYDFRDCERAFRQACDLLDNHGLIPLIRSAKVEFFELPTDSTGIAPMLGFGRIWVDSRRPAADMAETVIHELGHILHQSVPSSFFPSLIKYFSLSWSKNGDDWFPTDYARTNTLEFFAELFTAYVYDELSGPQQAWMDKFVRRYLWWRR
jgi:hypothetical protein